MASFAAAIDYILHDEGGYTDNPSDSGGATNFGITLAVARRHGIQTKQELRDMPIEKAMDIYRADYWTPVMDGINSQAIATKILELRVNMGLTSGTRVAQKAVNKLIGACLIEDGVLGPTTVMYLNQAGSDALRMMNAICECQEDYYWTITKNQLVNNKYNWPPDLQEEGILACDRRDLKELIEVRKKIKDMGTLPGNTEFIAGWLNRARRTPEGA